MDTARYASPNCPTCKGRGYVRNGEGINDYAVCGCAILGQRREAAELTLERALPPRAREMTFRSFETGGLAQNERALLAARNFVRNYLTAREQGWVLGFWGQPRSGKTHLAVAIAQACTKRYLARPMLLNVPKALRAERERFNDPSKPSLLERAAEVDLLVLDDLGAQYERQAADTSRVSWVSEQLYNLLDERILASRPIVYTTNLSPSDLERRLSNEQGQRILGRLKEAEVAALEVLAVPGLRNEAKQAAGDLLFAER